MAWFKSWSNETAAKIRRYNFTCAGLWAGFDARQASEADLTWQYHHKNRAISPDWCKLWLWLKCPNICYEVTGKPCLATGIHTSLPLLLFRAGFERAGCWLEDNGWNRKVLCFGKLSNETAAWAKKISFHLSRTLGSAGCLVVAQGCRLDLANESR